jgi:hypothetical protein
VTCLDFVPRAPPMTFGVIAPLQTIALHTNYFKGPKQRDGDESSGKLQITSGNSRIIPPHFEQLLRLSSIPSGKHVAWWRAQAMAYMLRPNERTLEEIARLKVTRFRGQKLLPGTISVSTTGTRILRITLKQGTNVVF